MLKYDGDNHLVGVAGINLAATYLYDGDGKRVKSMEGSDNKTSVTIGNHYETQTSGTNHYSFLSYSQANSNIHQYLNTAGNPVVDLIPATSTRQKAGSLLPHGAVTSTVQGYITQMAQFNGASYGGYNITLNMITGRELLLAIPPNASVEQMKVLQQLQAWATNQGVNLILQIVK